ncbi:hypothetical protein [Nonomuraea sp. NPDC002799]
MTTAYRSTVTGRDGFARLLRAEWTKLRTVRGWTAGLVVAALLIPLLGLLMATGSSSTCSNGPVEVPCPVPPLGPGGQAVEDDFFYMHQSLNGDGGITVRLTSMTGQIRLPDATPGVRNVAGGLVPWAKAGVMIKESTKQGSAYAAVMMTGAHGVRMQHDFTEDVAGRPGGVSKESPRWLRLTRAGDTITGAESPDGKRWTTVGTARLEGLPAQVRIGIFAASPGDVRVSRNAAGGSISTSRFAEATAIMDQVGVRGVAPGGTWRQDDIGAALEENGEVHHPGRLTDSAGTYTITGVGDIAPVATQGRIEHTLTGALTALVVVMVVAVVFVTAEYRRGLIGTTLLASPRRGRVLAAKAVVIGGAIFAVTLAVIAVTVPVTANIMSGNGIFILPVPVLTELRVIAGTAALLAVTAVFALALGAIFRRSAMAVIAAAAAIVVPYVLGIASILPEEVSRWLLRLTPAAGFAVQQSIPAYEQVLEHYAPVAGYFPLAPWAGFGVTCLYAALALGVAMHRLRRRDA